MQIQYFNTALRTPVALSAGVEAVVCPVQTNLNRNIVEIPLTNVVGTLFLQVFNNGVTPSAADLQNYGISFTSGDKVAIFNVPPQQALWGYSASANTLYPVEKF
jgi:hypothetical protein